jgi:Na+-driven multidrug efflux pump
MIMILVRVLLALAVVSFLILLFQAAIVRASFRIIGGSEEVQRLARHYFFIHICVALALFFTFIYFTGVRFILRILTSQAEVIESVLAFLPWIFLVLLAGFTSFVWDGVFIGATASRAMRNTLPFSTFAVFVPVYYFGYPLWGNHALWLGMLLFLWPAH